LPSRSERRGPSEMAMSGHRCGVPPPLPVRPPPIHPLLQGSARDWRGMHKCDRIHFLTMSREAPQHLPNPRRFGWARWLIPSLTTFIHKLYTPHFGWACSPKRSATGPQLARHAKLPGCKAGEMQAQSASCDPFLDRHTTLTSRL
jgi:hypothetical protein